MTTPGLSFDAIIEVLDVTDTEIVEVTGEGRELTRDQIAEDLQNTTTAIGSGMVAGVESASAVNPHGTWDFDNPPTVNGALIGGGGGGGVPAGGAAGAVLAKTTATDYDTEWIPGTSTPDPSSVAVRDVNGATEFSMVTVTDQPTGDTDVVPKSYADGVGTSASTPNTVVRRDASGNFGGATVTADNAPVNPEDLTRMDYVDEQVGTRISNSGGISTILKLTQAAYNGLATKDANTLYVIVG